MLQPVRVSAGRLTGRLLPFLVILAALVAVDADRGEATLFGAQFRALRVEIEEQASRRRSTLQKSVALLTGEGFEDDLETELDIQLLVAGRAAIVRIPSGP